MIADAVLSAADLHGTWRLERWTATDEEGQVTEPFGSDLLGYVVYTTDGRMITTISKSGRESAGAANADPTAVSGSAASSFLAYSGLVRIDGDDVVHTVEMSLLPAWIGTEQRRHVELSDDGRTLHLSTDPRPTGDRILRHRLRWARIG